MFRETIFCLFHSLFEAARQQMVRKPKLKIKHTRCKDTHLNAEDCLFVKKLKIEKWKMKGWYPAFTMTERGFSDVPDAALICQVLQMWHKNWSAGILGIYLSVGLQCFHLCFWIPAEWASCWGFNHNTTHIASSINNCGRTIHLHVQRHL